MNFRFRHESDPRTHLEAAPKLGAIRETSATKRSAKIRTSSPLKVKRRRKLKAAWRTLALGTILGTVVVVGAGYFGASESTSALTQEIKKVHDLGGFISSAEVDAALKIPESENAARPLAGATSLMHQADGRATPTQKALDGSALTKLREQIRAGTADPAKVADARSMLDQHREALEAYRTASLYPHVAFHRDYSIEALTPFPELGEIKRAAFLLSFEGALAVQDGNWDLAKRDLLASARLARLLKEDVAIIAGLVQSNIAANVLHTSSDILEDHWQDPRASDLAGQVANIVGDPDSFSWMLRIESLGTVQLMDAARLVANHDPRFGDNSEAGQYSPFLVPGLGAAITTDILRAQEAQLAAAKKFDGNYTGLAKSLNTLSIPTPNEGYVSRLAQPFKGFFSQTPIVLADVAARSRILRQAIAAVDYRRKTGAWPSKPLLSGPVGIDPHSNLPLKWVPSPSGPMIYSVGRNGIDDHGINDPNRGGEDASKAPDDIAIHLRSNP